MRNDPGLEHSFASIAREISRVLIGGRGFFALPVLVVCILVELAVQWATFSYEQQSAPPNTPKFPLLGVSLFGLIIVLLEAFKLPMAIWGASLSGGRRAFCNIAILVLCLLTWATIKDIGYNDSNAALASARTKLLEAQRLQEDHEGLDRRLSALKNNDSSTREAIQSEIDQKNAALDRLDREAADQVANYERMRTQELAAAIDPAIREQIEGLERDRETKSAQYQSDLAAADERIRQSENFNTELLERSKQAMAARTDAWMRECEQIDAAFAKALAQSATDFDVALGVYREEMKTYEARRLEYESARKAVESEFERRKAEHEGNDAPFYDKATRIASDRKQADTELARLAEDFAKLEKPRQPAKATPEAPAKPPRPLEPVTTEGLTDVDAQKSQREQIRLEREEFVRAISQSIASLRQAAAEQGNEAQAKVAAGLARLKERHDSAMQRIERDRESARRAAEEVRTRRDAILKDPLTIQREILEIPDEQQRLSREISRLKATAEAELVESYPGRMAQFLGYFMRESSQEVRIQAVLTFFIPALALIASFAPALVLEVVLHGLIVDREKELPKRRRGWFSRIRLGSRALRRERGLLAARTVELDAREKSVVAKAAQLDDEISARVAREVAQLEAENKAARDALAAANSSMQTLLDTQRTAHSAAMELVERQRADISTLANTILEFDAKPVK